MKLINEITIKVECSYDELKNILYEDGFKIVDEYTTIDKYMYKGEYEKKILDILKKSIIIRELVGIKKELLYKYKEYDDNENIISQGKVECKVESIDSAIEFMRCIGYEDLIEIHDECVAFSNGHEELLVQLVNDKYIFIEVEEKGMYTDVSYDSLDDIIKFINSLNIPYEKNNYFQKKAEIICKEELFNI